MSDDDDDDDDEDKIPCTFQKKLRTFSVAHFCHSLQRVILELISWPLAHSDTCNRQLIVTLLILNINYKFNLNYKLITKTFKVTIVFALF